MLIWRLRKLWIRLLSYHYQLRDRKKVMLKTLLTSVLLILVITNCHKEITSDNYNYPKDTPEWLQTKIDSIATIKYYALIKVYTYKWKEKLIYHFSIPFSSCVYCELYDEVGIRFILSGDSVAQDFMQNKKDKTLIWERKD